MQVCRDESSVRGLRGGVFVPTMGALHAGHAALIAAARRIAGRSPVVVSVFVNPTQFNDPRDFDRYPRTLEADIEACSAAGADGVFCPSVEAVYPPGARTVPMELPEVATRPGLEDAHRPGHFAGVVQVCLRLFEMVGPRSAVFGEKDWQQLAVVRSAVAARGLPIEIVGHATVREPDGLAMSSRNVLLTPNHRVQAAALSRALVSASKETVLEEAERAGRRVLLANRIVPEYFVVRDAATLLTARAGSACRALVAARVGGVRLIDNAAWPGFSLD